MTQTIREIPLMNIPYLPKLGAIDPFPKFQMDVMSLKPTGGSDFAGMLQKMAGGMNETTSKPDELLEALMRGDPNVDIHDVMIANSEAELAVNTTTQSLTKILQAYDRILQIQL
jgi:flagellar hook-basal body complex protein FliE